MNTDQKELPMKLQTLICQIRGKSVMVDSDLALLYRVDTKRLNEAVKRNIKRFPLDFMFQLTIEETDNLRSQCATSSYGGRRYLPFVFTEQGVAMLSGILNSNFAIEVNINIMRAFIAMRRQALSILDVRRRIDALERKYDGQFKTAFDALRKLLAPEPKNKRPMGFIRHQKI